MWVNRNQFPVLDLMAASGAVTPVPPNLPFVVGCRLLLVCSMASTPVVAVVVVLVLAAASFFFGLAETSLVSLSKWQAHQLAERHLQAVGRCQNRVRTTYFKQSGTSGKTDQKRRQAVFALGAALP